MEKIYTPALLLLLSATLSFAQQTTTTIKTDQGEVKVGLFTTQFLISTDFKSSVFLNMIGSGVRYTRGNFVIAISLFPTLRFHKDEWEDPTDDKRPFVTPGFSVGPLFAYKKLLFGFPLSYSYDSRWHPTFGMGVRIGS
jgi:hypothetical protein